MRQVALILYGLGLWLTALWLGWLGLAKLDFLYPLAYRLLDIPTTLETFVPQNRHGRQDFIQTDAAEHRRLFAAIAHSIRHEGAGLEALTYRDPQGRELGRLLTVEELTHLKDVAYLVTQGERLGLAAFLGWVGISLLIVFLRIPPPRLGPLVRVSLGVLALALAVVLILGPVEVFYAWHRWLFPPDHPWFFYYQDSLMSTLMQAPNLFGFIGAAWLGASLMLVLALNTMARWAGRILMHRRSS